MPLPRTEQDHDNNKLFHQDETLTKLEGVDRNATSIFYGSK